jgi:ATP-dependent RNA helicase DDX27
MLLLPTLSSEDELPEDGKYDDEEDEVNDDFLFDTGTFIVPSFQKANTELEEEENWNVRQRRHNLSLLHATQNDHDSMVERTKLSNIIAVARNNMLKKKQSDDEESSSADDEASTADEGDLEVDSAPHITDQDVLKSKVESIQGSKDDSDNQDEEDIKTNYDDDDDDDEAQKEEEAKKAAFFDAASPSATDDTQILQFSQFALSRPILRSVAAMGYVNPTPIQQQCIPLVLAGRDVCASAVTGSGKTAVSPRGFKEFFELFKIKYL